MLRAFLWRARYGLNSGGLLIGLGNQTFNLSNAGSSPVRPTNLESKIMSIKDHVRRTSAFLYYRDGNLWYTTIDTGLIFPVPIEDIGNATFNAEEKSLLLMRYIRKWLETQNEARLAQR